MVDAGDDRDVWHKHHLNHRMPRVLFVATLKPPGGFDLLKMKFCGALDCLCLKYTANASHWLIPEQLGTTMKDAVINALKQAQDNGRPYDFIITQTEEAVKEIEEIPLGVHGMQYKPPVIIHRPIDQFCEALGIETAAQLRERGLKAFSDEEMETAIEMKEDGIQADFDTRIDDLLGAEGIKHLECTREQSTDVKWDPKKTRAVNLDAEGKLVKPSPDQRKI